MLIIAQPKSASTSLVHTIGDIADIKVMVGIPKTKIDIVCEGYNEIQRYHNNMVERSPVFLKQLIEGRKTVFKEHLLPTNRHLEIIKKFKTNIVILLRNVDDIVDCYDRLKSKTNLKQIRKDISKFHDRWMYFASNKANIIVIEYRDLILSYEKTMDKILKHFKLKRKKNIKFKRLKYTGIGEKRVINSRA